MRLLIFILLALQSLASTYYVAPTGSDTAAGTNWSTAYLTVGKGAAVARSGDTVYITNGSYSAASISFDYAGASNSPIKFFGYGAPLQTVINSTLRLKASHLCFSNLYVLGGGAYPAFDCYKNTLGHLFLSNRIESTGGVGIAMASVSGSDVPVSWCTIAGNVFSNCFGDALQLRGGYHVVSNNCFDFQTGGDAIYCFGSNHVVCDNLFTNVSDSPLQGNHPDLLQSFDGAGLYCDNITFERNTAINCRNQGVRITDSGTFTIHSFYIRNNLFINVDAATVMVGGSNVWVSNNLFYHCGTNGAYHPVAWYGTAGSFGPYGHCYNNVFIDCGNPTVSLTNRGWFYADTNRDAILTFSRSNNFVCGPAPTYYPKSTNGDIQFAFRESGGINGGDPGITDASTFNFRLLSTSVLRNAGVVVPGYTADILGADRGAAWDIGPYEYVGATNAMPYTRMLQNLRRLRRLSE